MINFKWAVLAIAGVCTACSVADRAAMAACANTSAPELAVASCTRLLQGGALDKARRKHVLFNRGQANAATGRPDDALADFDAVIKLDPDNGMAHALRGAVLAQQGKFDTAMPAFDRALALDPNDYGSHINRGTVFEKRGQYPQAVAEYDRALAIAPDNTIALGGRCWVRAVAGQDLEGAVADCSKAIAGDADPNHRNSRGFAYFRMHRLAEAIQDYDLAIAGNPKVGSSYYIRGLARRAMGDEAGATADIAQAVALEPEVAARYAGYGIVTE